MSRQDPFRHIRNNPVEPIDLIPTAEDSQRTRLEQKKRTAQRERRAAYDQQHKVFSYYVPRHLVLDAKHVKAALAGLAYEKLCTESSLAMAFLAWAVLATYLVHGGFG